MSLCLVIVKKEKTEKLSIDCCTGLGAEKTKYSYINHLMYNVESGQKICYQNIHLYIPKNGVMVAKIWNKKERIEVEVNGEYEDLMSIYVLGNQFQRGKIGKARNKGNKVCDYCKRLGLPGTCQIKGFLKEVEAAAV